MKKLMVVIATALFAWNINLTYAQKPGVVLTDEPGWQKIGETVASFKSQDESIAVIGADEFSAIKIRVEDAPLQIERLQVFYESGDMEEIEIKERIDAGNESKVIKLERPDRDIQKVAFTYNTVPNSPGEKADVELYGLNPANDKSSKAYRDAERDAEEAAEDAEREAERAARDAERDAEKAAEDAERETEQAAEHIDENAENTESDIERAADETGDAVSEAAAKAAAEIDDRQHDTKVGPDGQTVYVSDDSRYYYINDEGKRVYVSEWELKDKPENE